MPARLRLPGGTVNDLVREPRAYAGLATTGGVMAFVQLISFRTSRLEEIRAQSDEFRQRAGATQPVRVMACKDRDSDDQYVMVAEFPSYEQAMANSDAPETKQFAARLAELCDAPPTFINLDVIESFERQ